MSKVKASVSRRTFIGGAAAGAAAVTVSTVPIVAASARDDDDQPIELDQPVVARVKNVKTGEVTLFVGEEEITVTDKTLARRLARAASKNGG